ncbi:hypothetical protein A9Q84_21000 [Halobacteriovorax marinus]|uniref:Response regulatory domain-containing protein n=1 Tax=Halobacteriovorax marinus TaxID=97084 RepID=A0A1Y5F235_9BACT|nr:hypothetical protein A9Q84_21000 [Halobacteriovorax marinus]
MFILKYPLKVVLIDDDPDMLDLMEFYAKRNADLEVYKFTSPLAALEYMTKEEVQIAIVDINMQEMFGDEVLRRINKLGQGTEVIIVTASDNLMNFTACYRLRASGFIFKPFTQELFMKTIHNSHTNIKNWNNVFRAMMKRKHKNTA